VALEQLGPVKTHLADTHDADFLQRHFFISCKKNYLAEADCTVSLSHTPSRF
jgi:hypothetical protein